MSNIFPAQILPVEGLAGVISVFGQAFPILDKTVPTGKVQLGVRPEAVAISRSAAVVEGALSLSGTLVEVQASGYDHLLRFRLHETEQDPVFISARVSHRDLVQNVYSAGDSFRLSIQAADLHIFPGSKDLE